MYQETRASQSPSQGWLMTLKPLIFFSDILVEIWTFEIPSKKIHFPNNEQSIT